MKNCIEKIVIISLIILAYQNEASTQEKSMNSGSDNEKNRGINILWTPAHHGPNPTPKKENQTLDEQLGGWFAVHALDMRIFWQTHPHTKLDTTYSCACTFNYDADHKMTNVKILNSSGSKSIDSDVLNAINSDPGTWFLNRLGEHTIRVDFSTNPSDLDFPIFSMSLLDETDNSKNPGHTTK
jgi:hypothetical protein